MKKIAIYGKGGIGKSTVAQNLAAALALMGKRVMLIGCDPKSDSTRLLMGGKKIISVLETLRVNPRDEINLSDVVQEGFQGIKCVESGGPEPGVGCAGRGIITAIDYLEQQGVLNETLIDVLIYDVLGDVVCGGFAMPIREGKADEIYIVCSGECQALYAANNIAKGIQRYCGRSKVRLSGIICNERNTIGERQVVSELAKGVGTNVVQFISRSHSINKAEAKRKTVVEYDCTDNASIEFFQLAKSILENQEGCIPSPLSDTEMEKLYEIIWQN